jgi:hypothetical protein
MPQFAETTATRAPRKSRSTKKHPTPEQIQLRAYEIYLERGGAPGNSLEDWVRAERELMESKETKARKSARTSKQQAA